MTFGSRALEFEMAPKPDAGRFFSTVRRVRLGDSSPGGRLRLDALVQYLQDVSNDDSRDAQWSDPHGWVVRRTVLDIYEVAEYLQEVQLTTWCGGLGSHWAERRTQVCALDGKVLIDAATLWVHIDMQTMKPLVVPQDVIDVVHETTQGRSVSSRLILKGTASPTHVIEWPLRFTDFDTLGHMNNAAYWQVSEELLSMYPEIRRNMRAIVEHVNPVDPGTIVQVDIEEKTQTDVSVVLRSDSQLHATMWLGLRR